MPLIPLRSRSNRSGGGGDQMGGARFPNVARHLEVEQIDHRTSATTTKTGLTIQAAHDPTTYTKGVKITDAELAAVPLHPHDWHGEWNYTINAQPDPA